MTTKYLVKFQSPTTAVSWPKIIQPEWISKLICNLWLYTHTKNQVNISNHSEIKWWQLNIWPNFKAQWLSWPKIIQPERISKLIISLWLYSHTKNQVNISNQWNKVVTTKYLAKFQSKGYNSTKNHWNGTKCKVDL